MKAAAVMGLFAVVCGVCAALVWSMAPASLRASLVLPPAAGVAGGALCAALLVAGRGGSLASLGRTLGFLVLVGVALAAGLRAYKVHERATRYHDVRERFLADVAEGRKQDTPEQWLNFARARLLVVESIGADGAVSGAPPADDELTDPTALRNALVGVVVAAALGVVLLATVGGVGPGRAGAPVAR